MKFSITLSLALLAFASVGVRADIVQDDKKYKALCDTNNGDGRPRACFSDELDAASHLKVPEGEIVDGIIDSSGRNFVLFAPAAVTFNENRQILVTDAKVGKNFPNTCSRVVTYSLPDGTENVGTIWCPGLLSPIKYF